MFSLGLRCFGAYSKLFASVFRFSEVGLFTVGELSRCLDLLLVVFLVIVDACIGSCICFCRAIIGFVATFLNCILKWIIVSAVLILN